MVDLNRFLVDYNQKRMTVDSLKKCQDTGIEGEGFIFRRNGRNNS